MAASMIFKVGDQFSSFKELEEAIKKFEIEQKVTYWKRDSRTLNAAPKHGVNVPRNDLIKYYSLKYACIKGGKNHISQSSGKRPNQRTFRNGCCSFVSFKATNDSQFLLVTAISTDHNHDQTFHFFPKRRKFNNDETKEINNILKTRPNKKILQNHIMSSTGKKLTLTDIRNLEAKFKGKGDGRQDCKKMNKELAVQGKQQDTFISLELDVFPMDEKTEHDIYTKRLKTFAAGLFNNVKYSDIVILLQGRKMPCHKIILAAQSDEWKNISQLNVLDLTDIKFQVAYTMIRWIYTDEIKVKMDVDFFLDLLKVAVRFKLEYLHKRCRDAIVTMMKVDNITRIQKISEEIGDKTLTDICKKFNGDILTSSISSYGSNKKNDIPYGVNSKSKTDNMAAHITRPLRSSKRSNTFTHSLINSNAVGSNNGTEVTTNSIKVNRMPLNTVNDASLEMEVTLVTSNESIENEIDEGSVDVKNTFHDTCEEIEDVLSTQNEAVESEDVDSRFHKNVEMRSEAAKVKTENEEKATLLKTLEGESNDNVARKSLRTSTKLKGKPILLVLNKKTKKDSVAIQKIIDASTKFNEKQLLIPEQSNTIIKKNLDPLTKRKLKEERRKLKRRKEVLLKNLEKGITDARKPYKCSFCDVCFRFDHTRKEHENIHTGERPNVCEHCGKSFREKYKLVRHLKIHIPEKMFACHLCDKKYTTIKFLNKHVKYHIGERKHKCEVCGKGFLYPRGLEIHMAIHTGVRNWSCHICGKSYRRDSGLNYHLQLHANVRPFHCDQCERSFLTKRSLALHLQSHSDERPYICDKCGNSFKYRANLIEHGKTHTEGRPHKCEVCNKGFNVKKYLKRHYEFACGKLRSGKRNKESQKLETENESYEIHIADDDTDMGVLDPGTIIHVIDGKLGDGAMYTEQTFSTNPL